MTTVYLAEDLRHNRNVALKVLKPELAAIVGAERFLAEIETTANLQHPHIQYYRVSYGIPLKAWNVLRYVPVRWNRLILVRRMIVTIVTISSRFQVVIPKDVRERLNLKPGQKVQAIPFKGRVELIPLSPIESMRGFLKGIDTTVPREDDRV